MSGFSSICIMIINTNIPQFSRAEALKRVPRGRRKLLEQVCANPGVQYVVLFESTDASRRNLLTVGPSLDYTSVDDLAEVSINGMHAVGYVRSDEFQGASKSFFGRRRKSTDTHVAESSLADTTQESEASYGVEEPVGEGELRAQLETRERTLLRMEEDLIDRMNQMLQKEAELEQWEENLFIRERMQVESQAAEAKRVSDSR